MWLCRLGLHMSRLICEWIAVETIAGMSCAAVALKAALPEALLRFRARKSQNFAYGLLIGAGTSEVVERTLRRFDDMPLDKRRALSCPLFTALDAALPFENRPSGEIVLGEFREYRLKIHLPVAQRTKPAGAFGPRLVAAIDTLLARGTKLCVLYMEHLDAGVIKIYELEIVELLQQKMAGVVEQVAARVLPNAIQKHFERRSIVQVLARMNFKTEIDSGFVKGVEDRKPSLCKFIEGGFDQTGGALRPGIDIGPRQRAGKRHVGFQAEVRRSPRRTMQLLDGPGFACLRIAMEALRREAVKHCIVSRVTGNKLSLQMRGKLGNDELVPRGYGGNFVAVDFAFGGTLQIEKPSVP
jgi:hypothetical protein